MYHWFVKTYENVNINELIITELTYSISLLNTAIMHSLPGDVRDKGTLRAVGGNGGRR